jgi:hypothetical protein
VFIKSKPERASNAGLGSKHLGLQLCNAPVECRAHKFQPLDELLDHE